MVRYQYKVRLISDAEPGTGLGTKLVDDLVPRNSNFEPVLFASHVKGLMREHLRNTATSLGWGDALEVRVFGRRQEYRAGVESAVKVMDAVANHSSEQLSSKQLVTRTAVSDAGMALQGALRTTEAIAEGTTFTGALHSNAEPDSVEDLAWRLALLSIDAVGASRNRGCGSCVVEIAGEDRTAGTLLKLLNERRSTWGDDDPDAAVAPQPANARKLSDIPVVLRLVFHAQTPICCPQVVDKTNVLSGGICIPASAVQGAILNRINAEDAELATGLFESDLFRAWPLLPCGPATNERNVKGLPVPFRTALTHKISKQPGANKVADEAIDKEYSAGFKFKDGVLLRHGDGSVGFWKSSEMPRTISAHGVLNDPETEDGRNLFTVDAMAPMTWQGLVVMPEDAADHFINRTMKESAVFAFGKSRSVRGIGELEAVLTDDVPEWMASAADDRTILIAQSPLLLNAKRTLDYDEASAESELREVAERWAADNGLMGQVVKTWADVGIQFGWSRHRDDGGSGIQPARRVVLPGSVIAFNQRLDEAKLRQALIRGIGGDRERGFGALSVHPGKWRPDADTDRDQWWTLKAPQQQRDAVQLVLNIRRTGKQLPSPSQIRAVQQRLESEGGKEAALKYLEHQTRRTTRIWLTWEPIYDDIKRLLDYQRDIALKAFEILVDLAIADQKGR